MAIDFTQSEIDIIKKHIDERWQKKDHGVHMGDIEVGGEEKPVAVWEDGYYTFVVLKIAKDKYKNMFYFMRDKRFDTGTDEYSDLDECVDSLMKAQADFSLSKNTKGLKVEINKE
ncbi:hypothetical protein AZO1586I_281 [Bathymodiolus thermophilus thioautotrophic gill symbiont]|jgi:hypothetical protein|uniref:Uncharacterized protein n=2 Tax=sulfur-oxidizing symbionts TaxID=32036 RepID=A0A1H6KS82_9GAMM|nr:MULTISPECIES: hypothetical protein [sulfur-oxidizing symbionts]CAC9509491.1 hypothetical protein [uncultured Gammaproteobacteria bacterium]CAB5498098.1 hypothetical protein AZO1586I_281 [Bathymodiolus thermophilus thioautotrophic gill symbiont]SEH74227.1 conserved hypothetical protein [Bathymodiolus azoricus thioautotrophic gill symbiont]SEH74508.1 conserved hypothetical protein [Bathymodiolus azoricus thioautotrophic gill symbiont]VVH56395.1 hypothetical protein BAZOLSSOX_1319 [uncultured 